MRLVLHKDTSDSYGREPFLIAPLLVTTAFSVIVVSRSPPLYVCTCRVLLMWLEAAIPFNMNFLITFLLEAHGATLIYFVGHLLLRPFST